MKLAELDSSKSKIVKIFNNPKSYKNISFKSNVTIEDYKKAGLYEYIEEELIMDEFQIKTSSSISIDEDNKVVIETSNIENIDIIKAKEKLKLKNKKIYLENSKRPAVKTSLGFNVDGSLEDINKLSLSLNSIDENITLKDADNIIHNINKEDLVVIISELSLYQKNLLDKKWDIDRKINETQSLEELKGLEI